MYKELGEKPANHEGIINTAEHINYVGQTTAVHDPGEDFLNPGNFPPESLILLALIWNLFGFDRGFHGRLSEGQTHWEKI